MIVPRKYQEEEIVDPLMEYLSEGSGNPIVAAPTGVGKSLAINMLLRRCLEFDPTMRFICAAHVREIVGQNAESMLSYWSEAPVGIYSSGLSQFNTWSNIIYAGIQSIYKKPEIFGHIDAVICDEAHTLSDRESSMWQRFLRGLRQKNPDLRVIGFTATPFKLGVGLLTELELFDKIVVDLTTTERINQFVREGYLCPLISKKPNLCIDIKNVPLKGGEFDEHELALVTDKDDLNRAVVAECIRYGRERKHWLVYATGATHAEHLAQRFRANGITCEILISEGLTDEERTRLIGDKSRKLKGAFQEGKFRALINVGVLTTGFDFPELDLIALARATQSTGLYIQILGRGTRPAPGKTNCLILDFGQNIMRLGPFNAPILPKPRRKGDDVAGEAPQKACPECSTYVHTRTVECPECGYQFPPASCIEKVASQAQVMVESSPVPQFGVMDVMHVHYTNKLVKSGESFKVSYGDLTTSASEYWFPSPLPQYPWMKKKFQDFWIGAGGRTPYPETAEEAAQRARKELRNPQRIVYTTNTPHKNVKERHYA